MTEVVEDDARWVELGGAILRDLDGDEPRLRVAQELSLDNPSSPRARFIRVQVRLASLEGGPDHPEWFRLALEARGFALGLQREWVPSVARSFAPSDLVFHRGFLEGVALDVGVFPLRSTTLSWLRPFVDGTVIRHLTLFGASSEAQWIGAVETLQRIGLERRLRSLQIDGQDIDDYSIQAITHHEWPTLRWLSLRHNRLGFEGVQRLVTASQPGGTLPQLVFVRLDGNPVDPIEQVHEDQGVVVHTTIPSVQQELPQARWLRRTVQGGRLLQPDRYDHRGLNSDRG